MKSLIPRIYMDQSICSVLCQHQTMQRISNTCKIETNLSKNVYFQVTFTLPSFLLKFPLKFGIEPRPHWRKAKEVLSPLPCANQHCSNHIDEGSPFMFASVISNKRLETNPTHVVFLMTKDWKLIQLTLYF